MPRKLPNSSALVPLRKPPYRRDEQHPAGQRERLDGADDRGLPRSCERPARAWPAISQRALEQNAKYPRSRSGRPDRAGRAGEPDQGQGVAGEALPRSTMNQPIAAASTATMVPARKALTMNGSRPHLTEVGDEVPARTVGSPPLPPDRAMAMHGRVQRAGRAWGVRGRRLGLADDDQAAVRVRQHLDRGAVQGRQRAGVMTWLGGPGTAPPWPR